MHGIQNDERELFARVRADSSAAAREALVQRYLPLAHRLAAKYRHTSEPMEDLQQVAAIGLLNAIDRFDPDRGSTFVSFAVPTILGELRRYFRDHTWALRVPRDLQELTLRIERARDQLTMTLARPPTIAELSQSLDTSEEALLHALEVSLAHHAFPLSDLGDAGGEADSEMPAQLDDGYSRVEDRVMLAGLVGMLSPRDAEIVFLRFHADLTQDAIASLVGVSQMQVSRVLYRSLVRLREAAEAG